MFDSNVEYKKMNLPKPQVHPKHPLRNEASEDALVQYIIPRLQAAAAVRSARLPRMEDVDRTVSTWIKALDDDLTRLTLERRTGEPQARKSVLPLIFTHLDDLLSYYLQVFAPNRGMFYTMGDSAELEATDDLAKFMNSQALSAGYYRQFAAAIWALLKYNTMGGLLMAWDVDKGYDYQQYNGTLQKTEITNWQGNRCWALDPYNTLIDPTVDPVELHCKGEFGARIMKLSPFEIRRRAAAGQYFNVDDIGTPDESFEYGETFWVAPPCEYFATPPIGGATNWAAMITGMPNSQLDSMTREITEVLIWVNPIDFNLVPNTPETRASRNSNELWRISLLNNECVIEASFMNNIHGHLPMYFGVIHDDASPMNQKSIAELIEPLQQQASFSMNVHVEGKRSNLYGTTFYDPQRIDYDKVKKGEIAARIPIKPSGYGQDIRTMVFHDSHQVDTGQTMQDVANVMDLVKQFFPGQALPSQIASIDRAIGSQVAAVQQGSNQRNQKGARLVDETLFCPLRIDMYKNIIQFFDGQPITDYDGSTIKLNVGGMKSNDSQYVIGMGLKTLDRNFAASKMQEITFALIQAPQAAQQVPLLPIIDMWTRMIDIDLNLKQFMPPPAEAGAGPGQPAFPPPGGVDASGNQITPITDPRALTGALNNTQRPIK